MLLLKLAFRNIFRQRRRSLLTGLSMGGGYVLLALSFSLVEGSYSHLIELFTRDHTAHIQIHAGDYLQRPGISKTLPQESTITSVLQNNIGVMAWAPRIHGVGLGYGVDKSVPLLIVGFDPQQERKVSTLYDKVKEGRYSDTSKTVKGYYVAMIGYGVADMLNLNIGDELVLISSGADGSIANDLYSVGALVGNRSSYDKMKVYLPLVAAQEFFSMPARVHEYAIVTSHANKARTLAEQLDSSISDNDVTVSPWQVAEASFYKSMQADKKGNNVTLAIVVFLICIGVLNTVLMSVLERSKEFGVMLALGTNRYLVFLMILLETMALGLLSCMLGLMTALPLIYWFTNVGIVMPEPIDMGSIIYTRMVGEMSLFVFIMPALVIVGSAAIVSLLPGIRATRITPLDALSDR